MIIKGIPYFYICEQGDQVPAALIPDKKGIYYKENFLASQPEFYMHMGKIIIWRLKKCLSFDGRPRRRSFRLARRAEKTLGENGEHRTATWTTWICCYRLWDSALCWISVDIVLGWRVKDLLMLVDKRIKLIYNLLASFLFLWLKEKCPKIFYSQQSSSLKFIFSKTAYHPKTNVVRFDEQSARKTKKPIVSPIHAAKKIPGWKDITASMRT